MTRGVGAPQQNRILCPLKGTWFQNASRSKPFIDALFQFSSVKSIPFLAHFLGQREKKSDSNGRPETIAIARLKGASGGVIDTPTAREPRSVE